MSPTPSSSSPTTPEPLLGAADVAGACVSAEPTCNGPVVNPDTGIAPAGQPLTHLGGSTEYLGYLDSLENSADSAESAESAERAGSTGGVGGRVLRRRALDHEEYHALVQDRMRNLDALEAAGGARLVPGEGLVVALDVDGTILDLITKIGRASCRERV